MTTLAVLVVESHALPPGLGSTVRRCHYMLLPSNCHVLLGYAYHKCHPFACRRTSPRTATRYRIWALESLWYINACSLCII
ncbi:hypothetical protein F5B20DRAFT_558654 [Whalleya microplaca]|nr:hypothetical protein F5B20DRAFT_558654 [Whalleya microplaca]